MSAPSARPVGRALFSPSPYHPLIISLLLHASYDVVTSTDVLVWRIWACRLHSWGSHETLKGDAKRGGDRCHGPEVDALTATLVSAAFVIAISLSFLALSLFTSLMHSHGRRTVLLLCSFIPILATASFALSVVFDGTAGVALIFLSVCLSPFTSEVLLDLAARTYVADVTTIDQRAKWFGLLKGFNLAVSSLGLIAGGSAATRSGHLLAPYALATALAALSTLYALFVLPESFTVPPPSHSAPTTAPSSPVSRRRSLDAHPLESSQISNVPDQRPVWHSVVFVLRPLLGLLPGQHARILPPEYDLAPSSASQSSIVGRMNLIPLLLGIGYFLSQLGGSNFMVSLLMLKTTGGPAKPPSSLPPSPQSFSLAELQKTDAGIHWTAEDAGVFLAVLQGGRAGFLIGVYPALRAALKTFMTRDCKDATGDEDGKSDADDAEPSESAPLLASAEQPAAGPSDLATLPPRRRTDLLDLSLVLVALACAAAMFLLWALARSSPPVALYVSLAFCVPVAMHEPSLLAYGTANVDSEKQDAVIAGITMVGALGSTLSAPVLGAIYTGTAKTLPDTAFFVAAGLEVLAAVVSVFAR